MAPTINVVNVNQPFSTSGAKGGTLVPGTYYEVEADVYQGGMPPKQTKRVIVVGSCTIAFNDNGGLGAFVGTYTTSGNTLNGSQICVSGTPLTLSLQYSAGTTDAGTPTFSLWSGASFARVETYVKQ